MRILVTGGAGMIGSNLARRLAADGHEVIVVDNLWRGRREWLCDGAGRPFLPLDTHFHELDLSRPGALDPLLPGVDAVFHLADIVAGIQYVFAHQGLLFRQNLLINTHVFDSVRRLRPGRLVYVGTACSFPAALQTGVDARPLREDDQYPAAPESAYGWSKLMGEYEALLLEQETGIPTVVLSLHNVYGSPCEYDSPRAQVIPALIRKALRHPAEPFVVWGDGTQGRAFVHVREVVAALVAALTAGEGRGVIQIGPGVCTPIREIAETVVRLSGKPIPVHYDTTKPRGDGGRCADYAKAEGLLGWRPHVPLEEGLAEMMAWISAQEGKKA